MSISNTLYNALKRRLDISVDDTAQAHHKAIHLVQFLNTADLRGVELWPIFKKPTLKEVLAKKHEPKEAVEYNEKRRCWRIGMLMLLYPYGVQDNLPNTLGALVQFSIFYKHEKGQDLYWLKDKWLGVNSEGFSWHLLTKTLAGLVEEAIEKDCQFMGDPTLKTLVLEIQTLHPPEKS